MYQFIMLYTLNLIQCYMLIIITELEIMGKIPLTIFKKYKVHLGGGITVAVESRGHAHL